MSRPPRLLFVGGCERSGTTLVQKVLGAHSRVAAGPELMFTWRIAALHQRMSAQLPPVYERRREVLYSERGLADAFRALVYTLLAPVAHGKPDALWLAEKTPSNIAAARELLSLFPDARFLHVLRDGRDVLASHLEVRRRLESTGQRYNRRAFRVPSVCARWNRACDAHFTLRADARDGERYHLLRYEELVEEPAGTLSGLFSFLGLELEPRALRPDTIPSAEIGMGADGVWLTEERDRSGFDPARVGRWRRDLGPASRLAGQLLMGANLHRAGYSVAAVYAAASRVLPRPARPA